MAMFSSGGVCLSAP
uniref:Transferase, transferring glycosyl groups n=1 Tax=Arundo donax TaxID=35708 RepID=A0A0A9EMZ0_ARUDO